ncbi:C-terminal binding protein [Robertmurraya sp. 2P01SA]
MLDSHTFSKGNLDITKKLLIEQGIDAIFANCKRKEDIIEQAKNADAIGINYLHIDEEIMSQLEKCKGIVRYGIGTDTIDIMAATKKGIAVCNLPDYCVEEVATHTMALLLDLCRKITYFNRKVGTGIWNSEYGYEIHRISSLTIGIIGFGNIGRLFASYVRAMNMNVIVYDPYKEDSVFEEYGVKKVTLEELYQHSDVISIHIPLKDETYHLICKESLNKMKDGVMIINTARGPIINMHDLIAALKSKKVMGVGLDVLEEEPIEQNNELLKFDSVVITPHSAYNSIESSAIQHRKVAETVIELLKGKIPSNTVNKTNLDSKSIIKK